MKLGARIKGEGGQALVLGALFMLAVALCVLTTAHLGLAHHRRMELQDEVDASAYSTAVLASRSLNAIAWMNRAMISQYVSAMAAQSLVSTLDGAQALVGLTADVLQNAAHALCVGGRISEVVGAIPFLEFLAAMGMQAEHFAYYVNYAAWMAREASQGMRGISDYLDRPAAKFVEAVGEANGALFALQRSVRDATATALAGGAVERLLGHAERERGGAAGLGLAALNSAAYLALFGQRSEELDGKSAKRNDDASLMAELANASRTPFESLRHFANLPSLGEGELARDILSFGLTGTTRLVEPMPKEVFTNVVPGRIIPGTAVALEGNYAFMNYTKLTQWTLGRALVSAEYVSAVMATAGDRQIVGIQASAKAGDRYHCRYDGRSWDHSFASWISGCYDSVTTRPVKCTSEPMHSFDGIAPYLSFALREEPGDSFGQPEFFALAKEERARALLPPKATDAKGGKGAMAQREALAVARSAAIYHRPGAWLEPPNLFNPFWRAKLAPLEPALSRLPESLRAPVEASVK